MIPNHQNRSGGLYYGWIIIGATFLIGFTEAGVFQNILSIFMKPMAREFGWSRAMITGAIAIGSLAGGILSPFVGPVLDRHGPRKAAFYGILILSAGLVALTFLTSIWQLYLLFGLGRMIAVGLLDLVIAVSVSNWFIKKRGRAMGIAQLGSRLGTAIFPAFVQFLIIFIGWRLAWTGLGITVFLLSAIPALLFLKRRPEDMGLLPDGDRFFPEKGEPVFRTDKNTISPQTKPENQISRKKAMRQPIFWLLIAMSSFLLFSGAGVNFHMYPFLTDKGISPATAVFLLGIAAISSAGGGLFFGMLAERFPAKLILTAALIFLAVMFFFIFWIIKMKAMLFIFAVIFGVLRGGSMPLIPLIWAEFYGRESLGSIFSLSGPFRFTANALGPVFGGLCFDLLGSYFVPFIIFSSLFLISGLISYFMPGDGSRNQIPVLRD